MTWKINQIADVKIKNPILIEGLPGVGNVGKIATDFIIDNLNAKKLFEISSYNFPHCVFVNEDNLVELPAIEIFHKKIHNTDFLFLAGDIQPLDERSCYEFCVSILAETFGHPTYLGVNSAKEILKLLNHKLSFKLDLNVLDREVSEVEKEI